MAKKFGTNTNRAGTGKVATQETSKEKWTGSVAAQVEASSQIKTLHTKTIPIAYVVTDPENPRKLALTQQQVIAIAKKHPIDKSLLQETNASDWIEDYVMTVAEAEDLKGKALGDFESLVSFAAALKSADRLMHPIVVIREDSTFHIIAGERRLLAHILLGETHIAARINEEPYQRKEIATLQWEENTQRIDMSLWERTDHIRKLIEAGEGVEKISVTKLSKILGNSRAEAQRYLAILRYPTPILLHAIRDGKISVLKNAAAMAQFTPEELQHRLNGTPAVAPGKPSVKFQKKDKAKDFGFLLKAAAKQLKMSTLLENADLDTPAGINSAIDILLAELESRHHG